jgi:cytochrome c oxidase subunit 2
VNEFMRELLFLPPQASTYATRVDGLHYFVITVTMLASLLIGGTAIYFMFRYQRRRWDQTTPRVAPSVLFETTIIAIPGAFFLLWFAIGYRDFVWWSQPPREAMDIYVMGKKWMWKFAYPDGPNGNEVLHVPVGRPVRLLLTSRDVIHSFWVPAFRIKMDALPGRYTSTWFEATRPGRYQLLCAEYCGTWHSRMRGAIVAMPQADFDEWLLRQRKGLQERLDASEIDPDVGPFAEGLAERGRRVAAVQGCFKCHSTDGSPHIGPTWLDLYMRRETLVDGTTVIADEGYLTRSIAVPQEQIVRGFPAVMPSYQGKLAPLDTAALLEFIKSLSSERLRATPAEEATFEPTNRPR